VIHVLLESNWVVDVCAPTFRRTPEALALLSRAAQGEVSLHLPAIALREARSVIRRKHQAKEATTLQDFRRWATAHGRIDEQVALAANEFLSLFANTVNADLDNLDARLVEIERASGVHVFALSEAMLDRALTLRSDLADPELKPFDEAILAAVLVRAQDLGDADPRFFCTKDLDLAPIGRSKAPRPHLTALYDAAGVQVRTTFDLS
jgi:hypothetical protein